MSSESLYHFFSCLSKNITAIYYLHWLYITFSDVTDEQERKEQSYSSPTKEAYVQTFLWPLTMHSPPRMMMPKIWKKVLPLFLMQTMRTQPHCIQIWVYVSQSLPQHTSSPSQLVCFIVGGGAAVYLVHQAGVLVIGSGGSINLIT